MLFFLVLHCCYATGHDVHSMKYLSCICEHLLLLLSTMCCMDLIPTAPCCQPHVQSVSLTLLSLSLLPSLPLTLSHSDPAALPSLLLLESVAASGHQARSMHW